MPENNVSVFSYATHIPMFFTHYNRYCDAFPDIKSAIQRMKREKDRVKKKSDNKNSSESSSKSDLESKRMSSTGISSKSFASVKSFTLQRRLSTATPVRYDM